MPDIQTEFLYTVTIGLGEMQDIGPTPRGHRTIFRPKQGVFEGPRLKGEILPGGGDWFLLRPDGVGDVDVRDTYRTDDGDLIYVHYKGILNAPPAVWESVRQGESVDSSYYYFRTTPYFETGSQKYSWLNQIVAVGIGKLMPQKLSYEVYALV